VLAMALFKAQDKDKKSFQFCIAGICCGINQSGMRSGSNWQIRTNLVTKKMTNPDSSQGMSNPINVDSSNKVKEA
jgi:hypothetical protein